MTCWPQRNRLRRLLRRDGRFAWLLMSFSAQARRPFLTDDKQGTGTIDEIVGLPELYHAAPQCYRGLQN